MSKLATIILVVSIVLAAAVGGTIAYIVTSTSSVENTFTPGKVSCEVVETIHNGSKTSVTVKNTGNAKAYIRCAVIANTIDANGNVTGAADVSSALCGSGWSEGRDGFYYYSQEIDLNSSTGELLKPSSSIDLTGIQVTILADAIQAEGEGSNGTTPVEDAWGITFSN
ncbi:MAG: hypothetical protein MJ092_03840 [Lachnospiraceae bacterium]|nr:hypothetical protein [Lachnospiraceae bacterium]